MDETRPLHAWSSGIGRLAGCTIEMQVRQTDTEATRGEHNGFVSGRRAEQRRPTGRPTDRWLSRKTEASAAELAGHSRVELTLFV